MGDPGRGAFLAPFCPRQRCDVPERYELLSPPPPPPPLQLMSMRKWQSHNASSFARETTFSIRELHCNKNFTQDSWLDSSAKKSVLRRDSFDRTNGQGINLKYHVTLCSYESFLILFQLQLKFTMYFTCSCPALVSTSARPCLVLRC